MPSRVGRVIKQCIEIKITLAFRSLRVLQSGPIFFFFLSVFFFFYQVGGWKFLSRRKERKKKKKKSLRHVVSFRAHSCLITMALNHFLSLCGAVERMAGPTLSHAHSSSILLLLLRQTQQQRRRQSHRMNGAASGMQTQREECHSAKCRLFQTKPKGHVHAHTEAPHKSRHVQITGGEKSYDFPFPPPPPL